MIMLLLLMALMMTDDYVFVDGDGDGDDDDFHDYIVVFVYDDNDDDDDDEYHGDMVTTIWGGGENVPGSPAAFTCESRNFTYLVRGLWPRSPCLMTIYFQWMQR